MFKTAASIGRDVAAAAAAAAATVYCNLLLSCERPLGVVRQARCVGLQRARARSSAKLTSSLSRQLEERLVHYGRRC